MGAATSKETPVKHVFERELRGINDIVNKIVSADNTFINKEYNFLSHDVCNKYQVVLETELAKHLKVHLSEFGSSIYIIPKEEVSSSQMKMTKTHICEKISNHYISVLYVLSLIKFIYNIEENGDRSFGGIIFRNVRVVNNMLEVIFCDAKQTDASNKKNPSRVNLAKLEGFKFFTNYFLSKEESRGFMKLMRAIMGRNAKGVIKAAICECINDNSLDAKEMQMLAALYKKHFNEEFMCYGPTTKRALDSGLNPVKNVTRDVDTSMVIVKNNPVFESNMCGAIDNRVVDLSTKEGKEIKLQYDAMLANYRRNIDEVHSILQKLVLKHSNGDYRLKDIDGETLQSVVKETKSAARRFFLASILDYQHLLDMVKNTPNVKLSIKANGNL